MEWRADSALAGVFVEFADRLLKADSVCAYHSRMRTLLAFIAVLSTPALAADFRTLNFGQSCEGVSRLEEKIGSVSVTLAPADSDRHTFSGRAFGRQVTIAYQCPNGVLQSGSFYFPMEPLDMAIESLHGVYEQLISLYGAPVIDTSPWQEGKPIKDPRAVANDPRKYFVSWRAPSAAATIALMPERAESEKMRRVYIVVAEPRR